MVLNYKRILLWVAILFLVIASVWGLVWLAKNPTEPVLGKKGSEQKELLRKDLAQNVSDYDWIRGDKNAVVTLVEYSDFECPACGSYYSAVKKLEKDFDGKLRVVYRHFPLYQIHKNSLLASYVSESAGKQGKFWEMHDLLFENQKKWSELENPESEFIFYAQKLGLDIVLFKADINSEVIKKKIEKSLADGEVAQIAYTPSFFLNNLRINNPRNYDEFKSLIESEIQKNSQ